MKGRQKCSFITDVLHAQLTGFHARDMYNARKFTYSDISIAGWLLIVGTGEGDTLHLCGTVVINFLFLFCCCRAGGEK
jgi:hypothetical protein